MAYLPGILSEIRDVAGEDAALAIADFRGGQRVWIPHEITDDHWLVDAVGIATARKIADHLRIISADGRPQGVTVVIPLGPRGIMMRARRRLAEALRSGMHPNEAARVSGLHERTAYRMQKRLHERRNSSQLDLF